MLERFTRDARVAVLPAREDARELAAREIGPQHLLLGVLQAAAPDLSTVLSEAGLTADAVRARLATAGAMSDEWFDDDARRAAVDRDRPARRARQRGSHLRR